MAGKITDLTALASGHAAGDLMELLDISDTTMSANGTNKKTTIAQLCGNFPSSVRGTGTTATSPALAISLTANTGFYDYAGTGNFVAMTVAGVFGHLWDGNRYLRASQVVASWSTTSDPAGSSDTAYGRAGPNSIAYSETGTAGSAVSRTEINKEVTGIADATATTVFTVTIPNAAHSASVNVTLNGRLGAGGAIGADEATGTISYIVSVARTAGANAVASISSAYGSATSSVAGAATITVAGTLGAVSGAVGAANTFTIRVTITKGSGASANHKCTATAALLNANATGITIA
jgi:hypothetical protein